MTRDAKGRSRPLTTMSKCEFTADCGFAGRMKALLATLAGVVACAFLVCAQALDGVLPAPKSEREGIKPSWSASREDHVDTWVVIVRGRVFEITGLVQCAFWRPPPPMSLQHVHAW